MYNYATRLKELRDQYDISARKLSQAINVSATTISGIENSKAYPSVQLIDEICTFFNITHAEFFKSDQISLNAPSEEEIELVSHFRKLDEKNKWRLIERATMMTEEQEKKKIK